MRKGRGPLEGVLMNGLLLLQLGLSTAGPHGNTVDCTQLELSHPGARKLRCRGHPHLPLIG